MVGEEMHILLEQKSMLKLCIGYVPSKCIARECFPILCHIFLRSNCRCLADLIWLLCGNFTKDMLNSLAKEKTEIKVIVEKSIFLHNQCIIGWLNWGIERYREVVVSVWRKCQLVLIWNHISVFLLCGFLGMCPFTFQRLCLHQKSANDKKRIWIFHAKGPHRLKFDSIVNPGILLFKVHGPVIEHPNLTLQMKICTESTEFWSRSHKEVEGSMCHFASKAQGIYKASKD